MTTQQPAPPEPVADPPEPAEETESPRQEPTDETPPPKDEPRSPDEEGKASDAPGKPDPLQDDENSQPPGAEESEIPESIFEALLNATGYRVDDVRSSGAFAMGHGATSIKNQYIGVERPEFHLEPRTEDSVRDDLASHVRGPSEDALDDRLEHQRLVCLLGEPRSGRTQAALAALSKRHGFDKLADLIGPSDAPLSAAIRETDLLGDGCGHLLRLDADKLNRRELTDLESIARSHDASIVVIADQTGEHGDLSRFVVDHVPPEPVEVFSAHLRRLLSRKDGCAPRCESPTRSCPDSCIDSYIAWCLDDQGLRAELSAVHNPHDATNFAVEIAAKGVTDGNGVKEVLTGLSTRLVGTARALLAASSEMDPVKRRWLRAFRIAYTVLGDVPLATITDAATSLFKEMTPVETVPAGAATPEASPDHVPDIPFDVLIPSNMRDRRGDADGARTAPSISRMAPAILDVAWNDYPSSPRHLTSWLNALVIHHRPRVRLRAAVVAGFFAGFDHELVFGELITSWAKHHRAGARQAAALACVYAIEDKRLTQVVTERIRRWVTTGPARARDTVARAYAAGLSNRISMRTSLRHLRRIASSDGYWFSPMVALAMKRLFTPDTAPVIIGEVRKWLRNGRLALAVQAGRTMAEIAQHTTPTSLGDWPTMACWSGDAPEELGHIAELWGNALLLPPSAFTAWRVLEDWIHAARFDPRLEEIVLALMERLFVAEPLRVRTRFHLDRVWSQRQPPYPTAAKVAGLLKEADG